MSASNKRATVEATRGAQATEPSDESVREFLKDHGDFLQRNPDLLDYLHIPHASGGAVSLVEKQVSVLRERNVEMRHRLNTLTGNAKENDKIYARTRDLVLQMLTVDSLAELYDTFNTSMLDQFEVEHACMILFGEDRSAEGYRVETAEAAGAEIGGLLKTGKGVSGVLRQEELRYLFPDSSAVGSAALMPLVKDEPLGLIAVGSSNANRYHSNVGTVFLDHLAEVIVRLLPRLHCSED
ncbi:MAG: DUF484 family protein [Pseudomonadota bacterium]